MVALLTVWRDGADRSLFTARFAAFRELTPVLTSWREAIDAIDTTVSLHIHASAYDDRELAEAFNRAAGRPVSQR